jgi:hypothetical protein
VTLVRGRREGRMRGNMLSLNAGEREGKEKERVTNT